MIGVNAAIATESGGFEGIGFTIPSRMAVYVANALILNGKVERGWLGISIRNLTPELSKESHAGAMTGAMIEDVVKGGPADKAGLMKNDVVIAYGGREIPDVAALRNETAETPPGEQVKVTVIRDGKRKVFTVTAGSQKEAGAALAVAVKEILGVEVRAPNPKEIDKYGLDQNVGVVITRVDPKGAFGRAGFEVGDMILGINGQQVEGIEGFMDLAGELQPKHRISVLALDHRTGNTGKVFVVVR